jgi:hypothetical protein
MKKINIYLIGLIFLAMALGSAMPILAATETSSMTCDEGVVNIGDADVDVQDKCGQPNSQSMNEWVYNFGPSLPIYTVIFENGQVVRILESEGGN